MMDDITNRALDADIIMREHPGKFRLIPFDRLKPSVDPAYLVKGLIPRVGLVVIWGPPKCGKSFWVTDIMLHVALGWSYRDRKVTQGAVVYCAFEGQEGYGKRTEARRRWYPSGTLIDDSLPQFAHLVGFGPPADAVACDQATYTLMVTSTGGGKSYPYWSVRYLLGQGIIPITP
jgi:hypothetical protein